MTPVLRRRVAVLSALLVVLVVLFAVQHRGSAPPPAARAARRATPASRGRDAAASGPVTGLRLNLLSRADEPYPEPDRNPFKFQPRAAPPAPTGPRRGGRAQTPPTPPVPAGPPPLPAIPWRLIGIADLPGGSARMGAFSDARGHTTWAKEGDIIDGRYRVLRVGPDSADLAYLDGQGRQSLRLSQ